MALFTLEQALYRKGCLLIWGPIKIIHQEDPFNEGKQILASRETLLME